MKLREPFGNIDENSKIVLKNTVEAFVIKGMSLCLSLVSIPAFVHYFNHPGILGVWYTLLSVLFWFLNFDLGIGNGIRNHLVENLTHKDFVSAKKTLSSGFFAAAVATLVLSVTGFFLIHRVDLNRFFNVAEQVVSKEILAKSTRIVFVGIMARFFLSCISSVFYALQQSSVNHFLALCVSLLQLLFVILVQPQDAEQGLLTLAIGYTVISNVPLCAAGILLFATKLKTCRPSICCIDRQHIRKVMGIGTTFFVCQITYMLLMNTNEFLIARLFGPQYTTEYTFYYKLTSLISMVTTLILTPVWSAVTKAMAEEQYEWVVKLYRKLQIGGFCAVTVQFLFLFVQQAAMDIWLGKGVVSVEPVTAVAFACFGSLFIYTAILSTVVCGMGRMGLQMICYSAGVLAKFGMVRILAPVLGHWSVVVWANAVVLLPYCVLQHRDLKRYFHQQKINMVSGPSKTAKNIL